VIFSLRSLGTLRRDPGPLDQVPVPRSLLNPLTWTGPLARMGHMNVYDPVNKRIVILGGQVRRSQKHRGLAGSR